MPLSAVPIPGYGSSTRIKPLFLLLSFSDNAFSSTNISNYPAFIFSDTPGVIDNTLADYYREVSGGKLVIAGDSSSIFTVDMAAGARSYEYYINNNAGLGRYKEMVTDALDLADTVIDYSLFDNDGPDGIPGGIDDDGVVDALVVVHAGPAAEYFGTPDYYDHMVSHYDSFGTDWVSGEGTAVRDWAMVPERDPVDGSAGAEAHVGSLQWSLGTLAHEFGHILGLPDFYDSTLTNFGLGHYDLMSYGLYGMDTFDRTYYDTAYSTPSWDRPGYPSAWSRVYLGWVQPIAVHADTIVPLWRAEDPAPALTPQVLKLWKSGSWSGVPEPMEYFLVEHRQSAPGSYDKGFNDTGSGGLLIYHVDETRMRDIYGDLIPYPNDYDAGDPVKGLDLEQADGNVDLDEEFGKTIGGGNFGDFPEYPTVTSTGDFFYKGFGCFWDFVTPGTNPSSFDNAGYTSDIKVWATWGGLSSDSLSSYTITVDMISGNSTIGYSETDLAGPFVVIGGTFDDGDDDPWVTAGLGVSLRLEIRHSGIPNTARGVTAVLDVDAPRIASVSSSTVYYGDLPALTSSTGDAEFLFTMALPAAAFTWVPLDFQITDTKGNLSSETVFLPVMAPPNMPPAVVIIEGPPPVSRGDAASFSWSGSDQEGIVEGYYIGLDSAGDPSVWTTATSVTYSGLAYGDHTFKIYSVDSDDDRSELVQWSFNLKKSSGGGGPCFVATALWGTDHWRTNRLRDFRDSCLEKSDPGRRLVRLYYRYSPGPAEWVRKHPVIRRSLSALLSTMLWPFFL